MEPAPALAGDSNGGDGDEDEPSRADADFLEYLRQHDAGSPPDVEQFLYRHPESESALRGILELLGALGEPRDEAPTDPRLARPLEGRYRVERFLASGGMAHVYLGTDVRTDAAVAIKVLHRTGDADLRERFCKEAHVAAAIEQRQRGTARVIDLHTLEDGTPYIVMEYVAGESLSARLGRGPLSPELAVTLLRRLGATLGAAHSAGVAHGDLKPSNVVLHESVTGELDPVLIDFGVARVRGPLSLGPETASDRFRGTLRYAAPESLEGQIDALSDQFSLGVIAWQMVTSRHPFGGNEEGDEGGLATLVDRIRAFVPPRADTLESAVSPALGRVIARAMAKRREERFASVLEFIGALPVNDFGGATVRARGRSQGTRALYATVALTVAVIAGGALGVRWGARRESRIAVAGASASPPAIVATPQAGKPAAPAIDRQAPTLLNLAPPMNMPPVNIEEAAPGEPSAPSIATSGIRRAPIRRSASPTSPTSPTKSTGSNSAPAAPGAKSPVATPPPLVARPAEAPAEKPTEPPPSITSRAASQAAPASSHGPVGAGVPF